MEKYLLFVSFSLSVTSVIFFLILNVRLNRMIKKYNLFMQGLGDKDVENLMTSYIEKLEKLNNDVHISMNKRVNELEKKLPDCLQHIGIVNYNAFDNVGNNMSFSIAAMDERKDGFVLTGIYSRDNSYVYAKEIKNGNPQKELSSEEKEAINKALDK
ncbi:MAG: DUF4446 family protein [Clostridiaceae bacterium]|nr:DUF4446 family protein [Clostridiaceae bacterium]